MWFLGFWKNHSEISQNSKKKNYNFFINSNNFFSEKAYVQFDFDEKQKFCRFYCKHFIFNFAGFERFFIEKFIIEMRKNMFNIFNLKTIEMNGKLLLNLNAKFSTFRPQLLGYFKSSVMENKTLSKYIVCQNFFIISKIKKSFSDIRYFFFLNR